MKNFKETLEMMRAHNVPTPPEKLNIKIPDAGNVLFKYMDSFLAQENRKLEWLPEYIKVAEWLSDNQGRGLFMFGNCGRGKSILSRYVLPAIILDYTRYVVCAYDANRMNKELDTALNYRVLSLDDIGTEEVSIKYGERRLAFAEIMDAAEKYGKLLIITTNLKHEELIDKYGERVMDRIRSTTIRVAFNGKSLRG